MTVPSPYQVSVEDFRADPERCLAAARNGDGPVALTRGEEVLGFFVSPEDYDALYGEALRKFLKSRMKGPTVSHESVQAYFRAYFKRRRKA